MPTHRIVSLLASGTELVCALGLGDQLVGRSHECDFPEWVKKLPAMSRPTFDVTGTSLEIDQRVRERLHAKLPLYEVDEAALAALAPDVVITQTHCEVCAVSPAGDLEVIGPGPRPQTVRTAPPRPRLRASRSTRSTPARSTPSSRGSAPSPASSTPRPRATPWSAASAPASRASAKRRAASRGPRSCVSSGSNPSSRWETGGRRSSRSPAGTACSATRACTRAAWRGTPCGRPTPTSSSSRRAASGSTARSPRCRRWRRARGGATSGRSAPTGSTWPTATSTSTDPGRTSSRHRRSWPRCSHPSRFAPTHEGHGVAAVEGD